MNKTMLLSASLAFFSCPTAAEEVWQYVLVNPDGTQVVAPEMDLSYPPVSSDSRIGSAHSRLHLIIIEPKGGLPEPMILTNKSVGPQTKAPPNTPPPAPEVKAAPAQSAQIRPPKRSFILF